jgi:DNA invertase Pin-like site-specific DNA recombinase
MATPGRRIDEHDRERIRKLRERLSQRETAKAAGVSPVTVWKICGSGIAK